MLVSCIIRLVFSIYSFYLFVFFFIFFFFKQNTAYEMRISDWSSDVCSSDLLLDPFEEQLDLPALAIRGADRRGGQGELIGEQHDGLAGVRVAQTQSPQHGGIASPCHIARQDDGLIARH